MGEVALAKPMIQNLVYEYLLEQIVNGDFSPHEKLEEKRISDTMRVSRTPVREALKKLETNGYVSVSPRKGYFVKNLSPKEIDNIYTILARLEGLAVELAGPNIGKNELDELRKLAETIEEAYEKNRYRKAWEENRKFHLLLAHLSENSALEDLVQQARMKVHLYRYFEVTIGRMGEYAHDHWGILEALRKKGYKVAAQRMELHIDRIRKIISDFYKSIS